MEVLTKNYAIILGSDEMKTTIIYDRNLQLVCPTHCTQFKEEIKSLYPKKCVDGGAGQVVEI